MSQNFNYPASNGGYALLTNSSNTGGYTIASGLSGGSRGNAGPGYEIYNYSNTGASATGHSSALGSLIAGVSTGGPSHNIASVVAPSPAVIATHPSVASSTGLLGPSATGGSISVPTGSAAAAVSNIPSNQPKISGGNVLPTVGDTLTGGSSIGALIGQVTTPGYITYPNDYINQTTPAQTPTAGLSAIEAAILRSSVPIEISETEEITVNGQRGIWANKAEVIGWQGHLPLTEYAINQDANPEVISKKSNQQLIYQQEVAIRYLRPPTPPPPGEIIIQQEVNTMTPPAPPLIIRQQPPRPITPQPLVVREAPPPPPAQVGRKVITISGKRIPPPPRKVVIERLAPLPSKPQSVIIERWLPYSQVKRRVIFQKSNERDPVIVKPRNVIIQWEAPTVTIKKEFKDLGVIRANPAEYVARYGNSLKTARELPPFVLEIKPPAGVVLAADYQYNSIYELEGDIQALRLIDLDREGLSEYRSLVQRLAVGAPVAQQHQQQQQLDSSIVTSLNANSNATSAIPSALASAVAAATSVLPPATPVYSEVGSVSTTPNQQHLSNQNSQLVYEVFNALDRDHNGQLTVDEAERLLLRLNSRLGRRYGEDDVKRFFEAIDLNKDGKIEVSEFRRVFESRHL